MRPLVPLLVSLLLAPCACEKEAQGSPPAPGSTAPEGTTSGDQDPGGEPPEPGTPTEVLEALGTGPVARDFPLELELPPRHPGKPYDRSRRQALEKVVRNLEGTVRRDVWKFASNTFFWNAGEEAVGPLTEAMDRAMLDPSKRTWLENILEAMGQVGDPSLAPALLRALEHPESVIRENAVGALRRSGTAEAVREVAGQFPAMSMRSRSSWLAAVRIHLDGKEAVEVFRSLVTGNVPPALLDLVIQETQEMPPELAVQVLEPLWPTAQGRLKTVAAGMRHRVGDLTGTRHLQGLLDHEDPTVVVRALQHLGAGSLEVVMDDVLKLSESSSPAIRRAVVGVVEDVRDDNTTSLLEILSTDPDLEVRAAAMRVLADRGVTGELDRLIDDLRTATGTRLNLILELIEKARAGEAAPVLLHRFHAAPEGESRIFVQALGRTQDPKAFPALREIFLGPEELISELGTGRRLTTLTYVPIMLRNLRGAEGEIIVLFHELPADDYRRRAHVLDTLAQVAADREDPGLADQVYAILRELLFDREEMPQMRLASLDYLMRDLTLDDAMRIKAALPDEGPAMRRILTDFLISYF